MAHVVKVLAWQAIGPTFIKLNKQSYLAQLNMTAI